MQQLRDQRIGFLEISIPYQVVTLIDMLVANIPTIETLRLFGFRGFDESVAGLLQLSQLRVLELSFPDDVSVQTILKLVKTSPTLKQVAFNCDTISVSEIMTILECSKNLTELKIRIHEMDMTLSAYKSILAQITSSLEVEFRIRNGIIDENIFK